MSNREPPRPSLNQETFIILMVVCFGLIVTLSFVMFGSPPPSDSPVTAQHMAEKSERGTFVPEVTVSVENVPLSTGDEPIGQLFVQSGCAVCHTIPGIEPAKGREGPRLVLGTNGPKRLTDPNYHGTATTVHEYIIESILTPGAYVVSGYPDRVMPRWYGKKLNAKALDRMAAYLKTLPESCSRGQDPDCRASIE